MDEHCTHYNEPKMEAALQSSAAQHAYDAIYEAHHKLDKLMDSWGHMYHQERREAIAAAINELKEALEVL